MHYQELLEKLQAEAERLNGGETAADVTFRDADENHYVIEQIFGSRDENKVPGIDVIIRQVSDLHAIPYTKGSVGFGVKPIRERIKLVEESALLGTVSKEYVVEYFGVDDFKVYEPDPHRNWLKSETLVESEELRGVVRNYLVDTLNKRDETVSLYL